MSKLPELKGVTIDREVLDRLAALEQEIATFRGVRHLWANAAANGSQYVATKEDLWSEQTHELNRIIYFALKLAAQSLPGKHPPHTDYRRVVARDVSYPPQDDRFVLLRVLDEVVDGDYPFYKWVVGYRKLGAWCDARTGDIVTPTHWSEIEPPVVEDT